MSATLPSAGKKPLYLFLALLFLSLLLFSSLTPLVADDFTYCYSWADQSRITSVLQIFPSMAVHRLHANGRVIAHGMVQLLLIFPKAVFNLLNACNGVLLAFLFYRYCAGQKKNAVLLLSIGAMLIWNFSPAFGESFLWLDGAVNYAWGLSVLLLYLWPYAADYLGLPRRRSPLRSALFLLLSLAAGAYSENGSAAILFSAGCLFLLIWIRDKKLPLLHLAGLLAAVLGYWFLMSAPASSAKAASLNLSVLAANVVRILSLTRQYLLPLYLLYAVLLAAAIHFRADRRRLILSGILILAGLVSLASFAFAIYFAPRHYCFTVVTASLACLLPLSELMKKPTQLFALLCAAVLAVPFLFNLAAGTVDIVVDYSKALERAQVIREAHEAGAREVTLENHICATSYGTIFYLSENERDWPNLSIASYYGFDRVYLSDTEGTAGPAVNSGG